MIDVTTPPDDNNRRRKTTSATSLEFPDHLFGCKLDVRFNQRTKSIYPGLDSPTVHNLRAKTNIVAYRYIRARPSSGRPYIV